MNKITKVKLSPEADIVYTKLTQNSEKSKIDRMLLKGVKRKVDIIKMNPYYWDKVAKNLIPVEYIIKYNADNLFRVELPAFWRMLYTLMNDEQEIFIIAFVVDIIDHDEYNKKFGYKKI